MATMETIMIPPVLKTLEVKASPAKAFDVFVRRIGTWWPLKTHSLARDADGEVTLTAAIEPFVGGRIYETLNTGEEREWGRVLAFEEGKRILLCWVLRRPREQSTEVEVTFTPLANGGTRVELEHRLFERMGEDAQRSRDAYNNGWEKVFIDGFGRAFAA